MLSELLIGGLGLPPLVYKKGDKMIRKIILLVLALILTSQMAYASAWDLSDNKYTITNAASTGKTTHVGTTIMIPKRCRILYFEVTGCKANQVGPEVYAGLYDCTDAAGTLVSALEGEVESATDSTAKKEYVHPLKIYNGVTILQGPYTTVSIEYEEVL